MMLSNNKFELVKKINSELNLNLPADDPFIEFALINYKLNADLIKVFERKLLYGIFAGSFFVFFIGLVFGILLK